MFNMAVYIIVAVFMTLWGGLLAVLMVWIVYSVIVDFMADLFPHKFRKHNYNRYLRKLKKVQSKDRLRAKESFNRRMPPQFGQACHDTIKMILEEGPDYYKNNGIKPPKCTRRRTQN